MSSGVRSRTHVVVLAESDAELRAIHGDALCAAGLIVEGASTAREALLAVQAGRAALIVLDRHLSDGDGWKVARKLKAGFDTKDIIVVGLAWHRERADVESALIAGCDAFLEKSCTPESLVRHVLGMLDLPLEDESLPAKVTSLRR